MTSFELLPYCVSLAGDGVVCIKCLRCFGVCCWLYAIKHKKVSRENKIDFMKYLLVNFLNTSFCLLMGRSVASHYVHRSVFMAATGFINYQLIYAPGIAPI